MVPLALPSIMLKLSNLWVIMLLVIESFTIGSSDLEYDESNAANRKCYGKEVDDFHTLDKQKIFALHHSAIQELDRENQELKSKNNSLENTVQSLIARITALENNATN